MHDGNNLFLKEEAFAATPGERMKCSAYSTASTHVTESSSSGFIRKIGCRSILRQGRRLRGFLIEKLKPLIDEKYRTRTDAVNTAVMGSSLGGVVSFYLAWQWPEVFGKVACLSSTFGYRDDLIERITAEQKRPIKIYLDSGWPGDNYEPTRAMRDRLIWKGYKLGSELLYFSFPQAKHNETNWAQRSPIPFQFLFGKMPIFAREDQA
jgi:predicted alpha/beta superfamily hydrolase